MSETKDDLRASWHNAKEYARLYLENIKLLSAEKLSILISYGALAILLGALALIAFFFISIGLVLLMAKALPEMWCFIIMGGVYIILAVVAILMRRKLLTDPIARFVSRLILSDPIEKLHPDDNEKKS